MVAATTEPGRLRAALQLVRDLAEDVQTVRGGKGAGASGDASPPPLWDDFTRRAAVAVRMYRPTSHTTLEELMRVVDRATLGDLADDVRVRKDATFCARQCHFVGARANAERCTDDPGEVVSLCSPDPTAQGDCRLTLCFDATELGEQIAAFRRSGRTTMPNPALADPKLNRDLLRPELDTETVEALEWQVALARERSALRTAALQAGERGLLLGIVLPALAQAIMQTPTARLQLEGEEGGMANHTQ
jgi:hypothetical protein